MIRSLYAVLAFCLVPPLLADASESAPLLDSLHAGGYVVLMRHAEAPGSDMMGEIDLDDCSMQRQLSARGREQARGLGQVFRDHGLGDMPVLSSRYCRCRQTAEELALGPVTRNPALDSYFYSRDQRKQRLADMRALIEAYSDGPSVIMVTHRLNILDMTGVAIDPADMLIIRHRTEDSPRIVGRISAAVGTRAYRP